jgi:putative transposase
MFAAGSPQETRPHMRGYPQGRWGLDEVFAKVNGKLSYLCRAVDHDEGEVLEGVVTAKREKAAALKLIPRPRRHPTRRRPLGSGLISSSPR